MNDDLPVDEALAHAAVAIRSAPDVGLACHVSPDGDALGSMLALHHSLRAAGIPSVASFSEPFVVAPTHGRLREVIAAVERFVAAAPYVELLDVDTAWLESERA